VQKPKSLLAEVAEIVILAVGFFLVINFVIQTVHVLGVSMVPTLQDGDYLIATKNHFPFPSPERGDIVILKAPTDNSRDFIKRVIAMPGERILIRDSHVMIDGRTLDEPYLPPGEPWTVTNNWPGVGPTPQTGCDVSSTNSEGVLIPNGCYFVMGDNRNRSVDSRSFGPIRLDSIEGKAWVRILPLDHAGSVQSKPQLEAIRRQRAA
jgi:signal peptidase I